MTHDEDIFEPPSGHAWPANWRQDGAYTRLFGILLAQYGPDRAHAITRGHDAASNEDLDRWRQLCRRT